MGAFVGFPFFRRYFQFPAAGCMFHTVEHEKGKCTSRTRASDDGMYR